MNRIRFLREEQGWTQAELGRRLNVKDSAVSKYETGKIPLTADTLRLLSEIFGVSVDYILCRSSNINGVSDDMDEVLEEIRRRPEMKVLFSLSKNATKEDIEKTVKIIEALKGD